MNEKQKNISIAKQKADDMGIKTYKFIQPYIINLAKPIGKGSYGVVYRAVDIRTNAITAVKQISADVLQKNPEKLIASLKTQIQIMKMLKHPNLVQLYDVRKSPKNIYLFMEDCDEGSLDDYIKNNKGKLSVKQSIDIMGQLIKGYQKLYEFKIAHRDLKPANILVKNGLFKLADFGFSKILTDESNLIQTLIGTPLYMSPQILNSQKYTIKSDIWSMGIIFYQMLHGKTPWLAKSLNELRKMIKSNGVQLKVRVPKPVRKMIQQMLVVDQSKRIEWKTLFSHSLFNQKKISPQQNLLNSIKLAEQNQSKNALQKSCKINNNYFESAKVLKYIPKEQVKKQDHNQQQIKEEIEAKEEICMQFKKFDVALQDYDKQKVQEQTKRLISKWVLHRRNKAVFLNHISLLLYQVYEQLQQLLDTKLIEQALFVLSKYQCMIIYKMYLRFKQGKIDSKKFKQEEWQLFLSSEMVKIMQRNLKNDFNVMKMFFQQLMARLKQNPSKQLKQILNNNMSQKKKFKKIFIIILNQLFEHLQIQIKQTHAKGNRLLVFFQKLLYQSFHLGVDWDKIYQEINCIKKLKDIL